MVLGEPFQVDGVEYVPADTLNYDEVGFAASDAGEGITAAHRTLPLPSYAEITSLDTGRTALVRIERRGPMEGGNLVSLSGAALSQIGAPQGGGVRVRRVNPPENERVLLRMGEGAPERLETPQSLLLVLKRKLPKEGSASLAQTSTAAPDQEPSANGIEPVRIAVNLPSEDARADAKPTAAAMPPKPRPSGTQSVQEASQKGGLVVQAAAFSVEANAKRAAKTLGGFVVPSGRFFRVQTGPYTSRGQANAALAKVKAAGYSDARVTSAG